MLDTKERQAQFNTLLPESLRQLIRDEAKRQLTSEGSIVRQALLAYFEAKKEQ